MLRLRRIADDIGAVRTNDGDDRLAVLEVHETDDEASGWLAMTWYKHRGTTCSAIVCRDNIQWEPLTLETALQILAAYDGEVTP
jgi:hypothetical protein